MATRSGYSGLQIGLHWLIAVLILGNYFFSDGIEGAFDAMMEHGTAADLKPMLHVYTGVAVLVLVAIRFILRMSRGAPAAPSEGLLDKAGTAAHWLLYALMFAAPLLGAISWYGKVDATANLHVLAVNAMMILVLVHSAAALFHQYVLKDGLLRRMMKAG
jgi:cytochrome b561